MFDSGISVETIITNLKDEVDIAIEIPDSTYLSWLNAIEQLCYSEIIKEQREAIVENPTSPLPFEDITVSENEDNVRFEDIHTVYADDVQLMKSTLSSGKIFHGTFYKHNDELGFNAFNTQELRIIYYARPKVKKATDDGNVMMPIEFIDMVTAKLRGEAYKLANEDGQAGKWLNDYNVSLEHFKAWCNNKASQFGM
jgi:hypothetical protein